MSVDPTIQRVLDFAYRNGLSELPQKSAIQIRDYFKQIPITPSAQNNYTDYEIEPGVYFRMHCPYDMTQKLPLVIHLKGNGHVYGSISDADYICSEISKKLNCYVCSLNPRLAPEFKFPIDFNDCISCIEYIQNNHIALNVDMSKVSIWGESSGGTLAAAISNHFATHDAKLIKQQILFYPSLDLLNWDYPSKITYGQGYMMDNALTKWFMAQYLANPNEVQDVRVSPILANSFDNLPETLLIGAQCDPMKDENFHYVENLKKSKVEVHSVFCPGMIHGFMFYLKRLKTAQYAFEVAASFLK